MTVRPRYSEREAFSLYLRYGIRVPVGPDEESEGERKFNPYHDPDDGRFTFAPGGGTRPPRRRSGESAGTVRWVKGEHRKAR